MSVYLLAVASQCSDDGSCPGRGDKHPVSLFHIDPYGTSLGCRKASIRPSPTATAIRVPQQGAGYGELSPQGQSLRR